MSHLAQIPTYFFSGAKNMEICDIKSYGEEFSGRLVINCGEIEGKYLHWIRPIETDIA